MATRKIGPKNGIIHQSPHLDELTVDFHLKVHLRPKSNTTHKKKASSPLPVIDSSTTPAQDNSTVTVPLSPKKDPAPTPKTPPQQQPEPPALTQEKPAEAAAKPLPPQQGIDPTSKQSNQYKAFHTYFEKPNDAKTVQHDFRDGRDAVVDNVIAPVGRWARNSLHSAGKTIGAFIGLSPSAVDDWNAHTAGPWADMLKKEWQYCIGVFSFDLTAVLTQMKQHVPSPTSNTITTESSVWREQTRIPPRPAPAATPAHTPGKETLPPAKSKTL